MQVGEDSALEDSFLVEGFFSTSRADQVLQGIDEQITYLSRQDPRMQFKMYGKQHALPRDKAVLGELSSDPVSGDRVEPFYKYAADTPPVEDWIGTILKDVSGEIETKCEQACNHVVVNQYCSGKDHIGFHFVSNEPTLSSSSLASVEKSVPAGLNESQSLGG